LHILWGPRGCDRDDRRGGEAPVARRLLPRILPVSCTPTAGTQSANQVLVTAWEKTTRGSKSLDLGLHDLGEERRAPWDKDSDQQITSPRIRPVYQLRLFFWARRDPETDISEDRIYS
jgi:hypothetical protein